MKTARRILLAAAFLAVPLTIVVAGEANAPLQVPAKILPVPTGHCHGAVSLPAVGWLVNVDDD